MEQDERVIIGFDDAKFTLGQLVATPPALDALAKAEQSIAEFVQRHIRGDWGQLTKGDWRLNDQALDRENPTRILSAYLLKTGVKIWIITEWDRSVTTVLLPEDY